MHIEEEKEIFQPRDQVHTKRTSKPISIDVTLRIGGAYSQMQL